MSQKIGIEVGIAATFLFLLKFWECSEIETVLVEITVLILVTKHLLEIISGGYRRPPTIFFFA